MFDGIDNSNPDAVLGYFQEARGLIERGWCRGRMAQGDNGLAISALHRDAVAWCTVGALHAAFGTEHGLDFIVAEFGAANGLRHELVILWNDQPDQTQAGVLAAFDHAIAVRLGTAAPKPLCRNVTVPKPVKPLIIGPMLTDPRITYPVTAPTVTVAPIKKPALPATAFAAFVQSVKKHFAHA